MKRWKRWQKALLGCAIAGGLLLGGELIATLVRGPPPPTSTLVRIQVATVVIEGGKTARLSHAVDPRQDTVVPLDKGDRQRVIVIGGSSVRHAFTQPDAVNFPTHLARELPGVDVVNFGSPGQSTVGLARLVRQLEPLSPDLILLYTGHNDFSAVVFQGAVRSPVLWLLPVYGILGKSWLYASLERVPRPLAPRSPNQRRRSVLPAEDDLALRMRHDVLADYEAGLRAIVGGSPAPVVISTLARNFDYPPTGVLTRDHPNCAAFAARLPDRGAPPDVARAHSESTAACGEDAALTAWLGARAARQSGDLDGATALWHRSLDTDPLPVRAPAAADVVIRRVAADEGLPLIDLALALGPMHDGALFDDTLHPTRAGAERIAAAMAPQVRAALAASGP